MARTPKATEPEVEEFEEELDEEFEAEDDESGDTAGTGDDLDDLELEEVEDADEDEVEVEEAPKVKGKRAAKKPAAKKKPVNSVEFGTAELLDHIEKEAGKRYDGRALRVLLRKMKAAGELPGDAADGKRYSFTGPTDAKVVAIIKRVKGGEIDEATKLALDKLKTDADAKRKAKREEKEAAAAKAEAENPVTDVEDDAEDDSDLGEDEVEEAPAPKKAPARRKPTTKKAAPARRAPARKKATEVTEDAEDGDDEE